MEIEERIDMVNEAKRRLLQGTLWRLVQSPSSTEAYHDLGIAVTCLTRLATSLEDEQQEIEDGEPAWAHDPANPKYKARLAEIVDEAKLALVGDNLESGNAEHDALASFVELLDPTWDWKDNKEPKKPEASIHQVTISTFDGKPLINWMEKGTLELRISGSGGTASINGSSQIKMPFVINVQNLRPA